MCFALDQLKHELFSYNFRSALSSGDLAPTGYLEPTSDTE